MSFILKTYNGDTPLYFYKMCRRVYKQEKTPAFREEIEDAYVFDTRERACNMLTLICGMHPELTLEVEELESPSLRGSDGYVPLEKTVKAMLSGDFKQRLWAEYEQLNTRRHKLKERRNKLSQHAEPGELLLMDAQIIHMHSYMMDLLDQCRLHDIDLTEIEKGL